MKWYQKAGMYIIALCMVCSMMLGTCSKDVYATYTRYVTASSLKIRKTASYNGAVVGYYQKGKKLTCYGTSGDWTKVKYDGNYRYVNTDYLSKLAPAYTRYVTASSLKVRKTASYTGVEVGSKKKGSKLTCYGTSGDWTKIKYDGYYRFVCTTYLAKNAPANESDTYTRYVTASSLNVRKKASTSAESLGKLSKGTKVTCYGTSGDWTKIKYNGADAFVSTEYLSATKPSEVSATGQDVADYAVQFIGNPYKWGGESLTNGADCSGFTKAVFAHFGYSLPHSAEDQINYGTKVDWENRKPGDLICYEKKEYYHVGIYIGNGKVVHAGSESTGIHTSTDNYRAVRGVRRIVK